MRSAFSSRHRQSCDLISHSDCFKNANSISRDLNCSAADVSQVGALTPAMWLISSGNNRDARFDSVLTLQSSDVARGRVLHIMLKKDFRVSAGKRGDLTEKLRSAL